MRNILLSMVSAALVAYLVVVFAHVPGKMTERGHVNQDTLDRILSSKTLRCGYVPYNPLIIKDANTGAITGIGADIHERIAQMLGVKIAWTSETTWSTYIQDLKAKRYDMLCDMDFMFPPYVTHLATNLPILYTMVTAWMRPEEAAKYLDQPLQQFNSPDITVSAIDGTLPMVITQDYFPKAKILGMPNTTDYTFNLLNVVHKKANVTFVEKIFGEKYLKAHPGQLVNVTPKTPIQVYAYTIPTLPEEVRLRTAIENIIGYMLNNGEIDAIVRKYEAENGYYVAEHPYRQAK